MEEEEIDDRPRIRVRRPMQKKRITEPYLIDLLKEAPGDILATLTSDHTDIETKLEDKAMRDRMVQLLLAVFTRALETEYTAMVQRLLNIIRKSPFLSLAQHLLGGRNSTPEEMQHALVVAQRLIRTFPVEARRDVENLANAAERRLSEEGDPGQNMELLFELRQILENSRPGAQRAQQQERHTRGPQAADPNAQPPGNFRELSIVPAPEDFDPDTVPFLRLNRVDARYEDLEQYLDIQFRLFREDCFQPLRENIVAFRAHAMDGEGTQGMRIYLHVQVLRPVCTTNGLCYRLAFDTRGLGRVPWESSRRLIYGSLVCLSEDNFQTYLVATVAERDPKLLRNGLVDVLFDVRDAERVRAVSRDQRFTMVESMAYFEAYKHVLIGLQRLTRHNFPFQRYIVECSKEVQPPEYLRDNPHAAFDLRPLMDKKYKLGDSDQGGEVKDEDFDLAAAPARAVEVLDLATWPTPEQMQLDNSQFQALRNALQREYVLIQGPPGTGKTYVGLEILKALLHNSRSWGGPQPGPILVVCFSNHALDQFLENFLDYFKGRKLLRVGARSQSERLREFSIHSARRRVRDLRDVPQAIHTSKIEHMRRMGDLKEKIHRQAAKLECGERELLKLSCLSDFIQPRQLAFLQRGSPDTDQALVRWLGVLKRLAEIEAMERQLQTEGDQRRGGRPERADWFGSDSEEEEDPVDDDDDDTIDVEDMARNIALGRQVDAEGWDDDDLLDEDDDESADELRRRLADLDAHIQLERMQSLALDVTALDQTPVSLTNPTEEEKVVLETVKNERRRLKRFILSRLRDTQRMDEDTANNMEPTAFRRLRPADKWSIYRLWVHQYCSQVRETLQTMEQQYQEIAEVYKEVLLQEDKNIIRSSTVVGMTTTGAARYQAVLQEIGPKIIIVEEAAEVLEAHVISTLSQACQHLILIGDHKQLRPNPTVYNLAKKFNLEISLFERMVRMGLQYDCLALQHRMRPEISRLLKPIYPALRDHPCVNDYPNIRGVGDNVYFVCHTQPEVDDPETRSYSNPHEVRYVVALCDYLIKQQYLASQITVLAAYSNQARLLKEHFPKNRYHGLRVCVVDGYQGEENDVIILSLVRSSAEKDIGFLKIDNRLCVALSRAKWGMYVVGNMIHLTEHNPTLKEVLTLAKVRGKVGDGLRLQCQNHPGQQVIALAPDDFKRRPEGGCERPCEFRLPCGHVCEKVCHAHDPQHLDYVCRKPCTRQCSQGHQCRRKCFEDCDSLCKEPVEKVLPRCRHTQLVPCGQDAGEARCQHPCPTVLGCGHPCAEACGQPHTTRCQHRATRRHAVCGHESEVQCWEGDNGRCSFPCGVVLQCGHPCQGTCSRCHGGRLHLSCPSPCHRVLVCGHECQDTCCQACPPCTRKCENRCGHSVCQRACGSACVPCKEPCTWTCRHYSCTKLCSEMCDRPACNEPCRRRLPCAHPCIGLCGEPCPKLCRTCNKEEVTAVFFGSEVDAHASFVELEDCGHIVESQGMDRYMEEGNRQEGDVEAIQLKVCPKCKTPIRRNLRYGNLVKQRLQDIEGVKQRMHGQEADTRRLRAERDNMIGAARRADKQDLEKLVAESTVTSVAILETQKAQVDAVSKVRTLLLRLDTEALVTGGVHASLDTLREQLTALRQWLLVPRSSFSEQERTDGDRELKRLCLLSKLTAVQLRLSRNNITEVSVQLRRSLNLAIQGLQGAGPATAEGLRLAEEVARDLRVSGAEQEMADLDRDWRLVIQAVGMASGHWYRCRNGHPYAIGECGRPLEEARCPECDDVIGGRDHRLVEGNAWAPEVDDAVEPPWSEEADFQLALQLQFGD